jgi:NADH:ubiquinone reductase (H+-translocating)
MEKRPQIVVIGAGFGGLWAAKALRNFEGDVLLIDRNNHHVFSPLLYQVATAGLSPADIAVPIRQVLRRQKNVTVVMDSVERIELKQKTVRSKDQEYAYDYLVVASGSQYNFFGHEEWKAVTSSLKTIPDATEIRRRVLTAFEKAEIEEREDLRTKLLTFIIVGAGPTGVEMAGALAELTRRALARDFRRINPASSRIVLCEAAPRILNAFPEELSRQAHKALENLGVEVRVHSQVESIDAEGIRLKGEVIPSATTLWAAGVNVPQAGPWLGAPTDRQGRVKVNPDLSLPGHPEIFVIGDAASLAGESGIPLPAVAPVAMQQGRYVAERIEDLHRSKSTPPFRYKDKGNLATVGRSFAIADFGRLRLSGFPAWLLWLAVHIFYLIGFRNRLLVLIQWAWAYIRYQPGARLIVPHPKV